MNANVSEKAAVCEACGATENMFLITANSWKVQLDDKNKEIEKLKAEQRNMKGRFNRERDFYVQRFNTLSVLASTLAERRLDSCVQDCSSIEDEDVDRFICRTEEHEELRTTLALLSSIAETAATECSSNKNVT